MRLFATDQGIVRDEVDGSFVLLDTPFTDVGEALRADVLPAIRRAPVAGRMADLDSLQLRAPVRHPGRFVIVGLNYHSHVDEFAEALGIEANHDVGDPFVFEAPGTAVAGPGQPILRPTEAPDQVDYEGEVGLVIGCAGHDVAARDGWGMVAGLTVVNDVSARDVQTEAMVSGKGVGGSKSFPTFKPIGPCLATVDGFDEDLDVRLTTRVNGEVRQDASTSDMIHPLGELLAFISRQMVLEPGDIVCTGSPRGVGMWSGGRFLVPGDEVAVTVEGVGTLTNPVA